MPKPLRSLPADTWNNLFYPPSDYRYFEECNQFEFEPDARDFSWRNAWWLADASLLAYVKDVANAGSALARAGFSSVCRIGENPLSSTKAFFAVRSASHPFALLAFRGTDRDDFANVVTDVRTLPWPDAGYLVHRGFALALESVWPQIEPLLNQFVHDHPEAPVYFTGHSLGAALATLAMLRFTGTNCALYTFGSPRVGDARFRQALLAKSRRIFRFVNSQDIVTQVPPPGIFLHAGTEKYIDRQGAIRDEPSEVARIIDAAFGSLLHDGFAAMDILVHVLDAERQMTEVFRDPVTYLKNATLNPVNPPQYLIGNHTAARYSARIWNFYQD